MNSKVFSESFLYWVDFNNLKNVAPKKFEVAFENWLPTIWETTSCLIWIVESLYTYAKICSFLTVADFNKFQHIIVQCTLNDATFDMNLIGPLWMGVSLIFIHIRCLLLCRCFMFYEIPGKNLMSSFHPPTYLTYFS